MASSELDWTVTQSYELDSTEGTTEDEDEATEGTTDDEVSMDADSTELTQDKFGASLDADSTEQTQDKFGVALDADSTEQTRDKFAEDIGTTGSKIPSSEIIVRTIAVERAPLVALPADADAAFGQWLANSGLAPSKH